ncbi:hypothetical protein [Lutimonas vermicola]|uniref:Uncharacterized protein n=1 Tax=Lutimonas vermicola TaxID=414288 RepID=A0ABU9L2A8_9FLAO
MEEAIAPEAQRLGLWWSKNYQIDAQKNKISLDLFVLLHQGKRTEKNISRIQALASLNLRFHAL